MRQSGFLWKREERRKKSLKLFCFTSFRLWPFFFLLLLLCFETKKVNVLHFNYRRYIKKWGLIKGKADKLFISLISKREREREWEKILMIKYDPKLPIFAFQIILIVLSPLLNLLKPNGCIFWPGVDPTKLGFSLFSDFRS